jgi:hypothetical protein
MALPVDANMSRVACHFLIALLFETMRGTKAQVVEIAMGLPFDAMDSCPSPAPGNCPVNLVQSSLWPVSYLQPCTFGLTNVFLEDPFSEAVMHSCDSTAHGALPMSCDDTFFRSIGYDEPREHVYLTTGLRIVRASLSQRENALTPVVAGFVEVRIKGFNLGSLTSFAVKGVECRSLLFANDTDAACLFGDQEVLSSPIAPSCVVVGTSEGGQFRGAVSQVIATARLNAGFQKPLVYNVTVVDRGFHPTAFALDSARQRMYWWNRAVSTRRRKENCCVLLSGKVGDGCR